MLKPGDKVMMEMNFVRQGHYDKTHCRVSFPRMNSVEMVAKMSEVLPTHPSLPRIAQALAADPSSVAVVLTREEWMTVLKTMEREADEHGMEWNYATATYEPEQNPWADIASKISAQLAAQEASDAT